LQLRSQTRVVALAAAAAFVWPPVLLGAVQVTVAARGPEPGDPMPRVGELFRDGQDRFETSDFEGAIELWTEAYEELPDGPEHAPTRALLLANIAQAHVRAHAVGGGIDHLRRADALYTEYLTMIDAADTQTRETVEAERERIAAILAEHERAQEEEAEARSEPPPDPRPAPPPAVPTKEARPAGLEPFKRWERAMVLSGGVTLAFGVALTGATGTFLWLRDEAEKEGSVLARDPQTDAARLRSLGRSARRFNGLAISTGAAAAVLAAIGLGLIGGGYAHRNRRLKRAEATMAPVLSARSVGMGAAGRF
jgi:hypothetical protein